MKQAFLAGLIMGGFTLGLSTQVLATHYDFETVYDGTSYTLASAADPLTQSLGAGDDYTYTINTAGTDYFEVINGPGWNPWLWIFITDTAVDVNFDYSAELLLGAASVLDIPLTGTTHSTSLQVVKYIGLPGGGFVPDGTIFDQVILTAQIFPGTTTPFSFKSYEPTELNRVDLIAYVANDGGPGPDPGPGPGPGPDPVPEPATMLLFGAGLAGLAGTRYRKKKK